MSPQTKASGRSRPPYELHKSDEGLPRHPRSLYPGTRTEPLRVCRRLQPLRRWSHEPRGKQEVFPRKLKLQSSTLPAFRCPFLAELTLWHIAERAYHNADLRAAFALTRTSRASSFRCIFLRTSEW